MAVFELQGPDGAIYEVDAPDEATAFQQFQQSMSNSPVTEDAQMRDTMWQQAQQAATDAEANDLRWMDRANAFTQGASNAMTLGASGLAQRRLGALADKGLQAIGAAPQEMTYDDFMQNIAQRQQDTSEKAPLAGLAGTVAGAFGPGGLVGKGLQGLSGLARIPAMAGFGAAESLGVSAGQGELTPENAGSTAAFGAGFGGAGQVVGELAQPLTRAVLGRTSLGQAGRARRELADSLMDDAVGQGSIAASTNRGQGYTPEQLRELASGVGGPNEQRFGEATPRLLQYFEGLTSNPNVTGLTEDAGTMAAQRSQQMDQQAMDTIADFLTDSNRAVTGDAASVMAGLTKDQSKQLYSEIFDTTAARSAPIVEKTQLNAAVQALRDQAGFPIFDARNASETTMRTMQAVQNKIAGMGGENPGITLKGLQNLKFELDGMIDSARRGRETATGNMDLRSLYATKRFVNEQLEAFSPEYREAATKFATAEGADAAERLGRDMMKGTNTTFPVDEIDAAMASLTGPERGHAQDAALTWLQGQVEQSPASLKKLAQNKGMRDRLNAIFGTALDSNSSSIDEFSATIDDLLTRKAAYDQMKKNVDRSARGTPAAAGYTSGQDIIDVASAAGAGLAFGPASSAVGTRIRRLFRPDPSARDQLAFQLFNQSDPATANALVDEIIAAKQAPSASTLWGAAGGGYGAGLNTIME